MKLSEILIGLALVLAFSNGALAQIDRAKDGPFKEFIKYHVITVQKSKENIKDATEANEDMDDALDDLVKFMRGIPSRMRDGGMGSLEAETKKFLESVKRLKSTSEKLQRKFKSGSLDFKSEISAYEKDGQEVRSKFVALYAKFKKSGNKIYRAYEAMKRSCANQCLR